MAGPDTHLFVLAIPRFHTECLIFGCHGRQVLHLFLRWLADDLLHFVYKLLSNPWKHHITTILFEVFCFCCWLENTVHPFPIDVVVIFSWIPWPIHEVRFRNELCQLPLISVIIPATKVLYNISGLSGFAIFQCPAHFRSKCLRFFIDGHNA